MEYSDFKEKLDLLINDVFSDYQELLKKSNDINHLINKFNKEEINSLSDNDSLDWLSYLTYDSKINMLSRLFVALEFVSNPSNPEIADLLNSLIKMSKKTDQSGPKISL